MGSFFLDPTDRPVGSLLVAYENNDIFVGWRFSSRAFFFSRFSLVAPFDQKRMMMVLLLHSF